MTRLNKFLAGSLEISRRKADILINEGRVRVNSKVAKIGTTIDIENDVVTYNNQEIYEAKKNYYSFYKPRGYICSRNKQGNSNTIYSILKDNSLKYAGRLDKDSEGLLLLSNDGDWINQLTHPKYKVKKIYLVETKIPININQFKLRIRIQDSNYEILDLYKINKYLYKVTLGTGKNREIREIFKYNNIELTSLKRIQMGEFVLGDMKPGELKKIEINKNDK